MTHYFPDVWDRCGDRRWIFYENVGEKRFITLFFPLSKDKRWRVGGHPFVLFPLPFPLLLFLPQTMVTIMWRELGQAVWDETYCGEKERLRWRVWKMDVCKERYLTWVVLWCKRCKGKMDDWVWWWCGELISLEWSIRSVIRTCCVDMVKGGYKKLQWI